MKPTALKVVEGNRSKVPRKVREAKAAVEPHYIPLTEQPPAWLPPEAKAEWRRLMKHVGSIPGLLQYPDRAAMISLCTEWDRYLKAVKDIQRNGLMIEGMSRGESGMVKNPALQASREALQALFHLWSRFGLTPADRARVQGPPQVGTHDPILDLLD